MILADQAGAAFRADLNDALAALVAQNSGATEPATMYAYMFWADTTAGRLKQRNAANNAWLDRGPLAGVFATFTELVKFDKGADIASGATVDLGTATGNSLTVTHSTGTTAITSLGGASLPAGTEIETIFSISGGTLTITHHATNLYLAGAANITLADKDAIRWRKMRDSNAEWKMVGGVRANGAAWASSSYYAGQVLQEVYATDAGSTTASATLANVTAGAKTITPKSSSSTIIVECMFQGIITAGGAGTNTTAAFRLYDDGNSANIGTEYSLGVVSGAGANVQTQVPCRLAAYVSNSALTARSFILRARYGTTYATVTATNHVWRIREVQN
jgi:hypothetical protein